MPIMTSMSLRIPMRIMATERTSFINLGWLLVKYDEQLGKRAA
jgi:hypothetical protein